MAWGSGKGAGSQGGGKYRKLAGCQKRQGHQARGTARREDEQMPLEDVILDHVAWLECAEGDELTREVEDIEAQVSALWDLPSSGRVTPLKDIVEVSSLLEDLWEEAEPSSTTEAKARLVYAARLLRTLKQSGRAVSKTVPVAVAAPPAATRAEAPLQTSAGGASAVGSKSSAQAPAPGEAAGSGRTATAEEARLRFDQVRAAARSNMAEVALLQHNLLEGARGLEQLRLEPALGRMFF